MQVIQWVQSLPQTGFPSLSVMLFVGQRFAHWPHPVQASDTVNASALTKQE